MDALELDTSYCVVCNQFIWPERYQVQVDAPATLSPTVNPSTVRVPKESTVRPTPPNTRTRKTQSALCRAPSTRKSLTLPTLEGAIGAPAPKLRTVISQEPTPIYCSDICRSHDVESGNRAETSLKTLFDPSYSPSPISPLTSGSESEFDTDHSNADYFARLVPRRPWPDRRMSGASTVSMSSSSSASSSKDYLYENRRRARAYLAESAARLNRSDSQSALPWDHPESAADLPPVPERPAAVPFTHHRFKESSHHAMPLPLPTAPDASELYASYPLFVRTRSDASVKRDSSPPALSSSLPEGGTERTPAPRVSGLPLRGSLSVGETKGLLVPPVLIRSESTPTMSQLSSSWDDENILESLRSIQTDSRSKGERESRRTRKPLSKAQAPKSHSTENRRLPDEVGPTYPVLQLPRPKKTVVKTIIAREVLKDGSERLVERKVTEEIEEEPKKLFTFINCRSRANIREPAPAATRSAPVDPGRRTMSSKGTVTATVSEKASKLSPSPSRPRQQIPNPALLPLDSCAYQKSNTFTPRGHQSLNRHSKKDFSSATAPQPSRPVPPSKPRSLSTGVGMRGPLDHSPNPMLCLEPETDGESMDDIPSPRNTGSHRPRPRSPSRRPEGGIRDWEPGTQRRGILTGPTDPALPQTQRYPRLLYSSESESDISTQDEAAEWQGGTEYHGVRRSRGSHTNEIEAIEFPRTSAISRQDSDEVRLVGTGSVPPRKEVHSPQRGDSRNQDVNLLRSKTATTPLPRVVISHKTSLASIIKSLINDNCPDVTQEIESIGAHPEHEGGLGDVYRARLHDESLVAVKCLKMQSDSNVPDGKLLKRAARELYMWSRASHPNILELYGLATVRNKLAMVAPWMEYGSLLVYLDARPTADRCDLCAQVAAGLAYIHDLGLVHGDIKCNNVVVSEDGTPKLTDFGSAAMVREFSIAFTNTQDGKFSIRWAAPELFRDQPVCFETDIYAFGMMVLEAITGAIPYKEMNDYVFMASVLEGKLPDRPMKHIPPWSKKGDQFWSILTCCWDRDPMERPTIDEIYGFLDTITQEDLEVMFA